MIVPPFSKLELRNFANASRPNPNIKNANLKAVAHFGLVIENDNSIFDQSIHFGPNAGVDWIQHLLDNEQKFTDYISTNIPRKKLTQKQRDLYENQISCGERWCQGAKMYVSMSAALKGNFL